MHRGHGFLVLGSVVLCVTGGEALYADMGHFGTRAIRLAWYACVFPALLINYFGQGALLLERPEAAANPFYALVSGAWLYPMVMLATVATVVASQALISGAFSLTRQAVQLGYLPRVTIVHTSGQTEGQIYIPEVNWLLMVACVALVLGFRESSALADAYGIAVTGTMAITSMLFYFVARDRWNWGAVQRGGAAGAVPLLRSLVLRRLFGEDRARRLVPAGGRGRRLHRHDDLEARPRRCWRSGSPPTRCRWRSSSPTSRRPSRTAWRARRCSWRRRGAGRRTCSCTTSSTTRCCTSRW